MDILPKRFFRCLWGSKQRNPKVPKVVYLQGFLEGLKVVALQQVSGFLRKGLKVVYYQRFLGGRASKNHLIPTLFGCPQKPFITNDYLKMVNADPRDRGSRMKVATIIIAPPVAVPSCTPALKSTPENPSNTNDIRQPTRIHTPQS
jgi:hypothetical protein